MLCVLFVSNVRKLSKQLDDEYYDADFAADLYRSSSFQSFPSMFVALVSMDLRVWLNLLTRLDSTAKALAVTSLRRKNTINNTCYHWYPFTLKTVCGQFGIMSQCSLVYHASPTWNTGEGAKTTQSTVNLWIDCCVRLFHSTERSGCTMVAGRVLKLAVLP